MEHKRRTSARSGKAGAHGVGTAIFVLLSIALIAGIIVLSPAGDFLLNHVLVPVFSCTSSEKKEDADIVETLKSQDQPAATESPSAAPSEKTKQQITLDETPFYILQMGAFTEKEAAAERASEILRMGAGGVVYPEGAVFRVFAAAYTDEESLMKVQAQVRADGFEATPYIVEKKALKLTLEGDKEAVQIVSDAAKALDEIPTELCSIALSYDKGSIDAEKLLGSVTDLKQKTAEILEKMQQIKDPTVQPIKDLLDQYAENISTFLLEHDTIHTEMISGELKRLQLQLIIDYILFFDQK